MRVVYQAPEGCPDEQTFVARVRSRTEHGHFADPGELARTFDVAISEPEPHEFSGKVEFVDVDGQSARRNVASADCDEVSSSLALIVALSIDDRAAQVVAEARADKSPAATPSGAKGKPQQKKEADPGAASSSHARARSAAPKSPALRVDLGVHAELLSWLSPNAAFAPGGFVGLGARGQSWSLRLSGSDVRQTVNAPLGSAHFTTDFLRLETCPFALGFASHFSFAPCVGVDGGVLHARGAGSALARANDKTLPWFSGVLLARLGWEYERRLVLSLDGELGAPFVRQHFEFDNPRTALFSVPSLGVGAKAGVAVRFP